MSRGTEIYMRGFEAWEAYCATKPKTSSPRSMMEFIVDELDDAITEALRKPAKAMAYMLGIPFYIRDGGIHQHGPGERVDPPPGAAPAPHGYRTQAEAKP